MIPAAWPYVVSLAAAAALFYGLAHPWPAAALLAGAACVAFFFRDPERVVPGGDGVVVAPADGRVVEARPASEGAAGKIAIFLSLLDVHVNRSPVTGRVRSVTYRPGSFRPAYAPEASSLNECNHLELEGPGGRFGVSQIAGIVARRIRCFKQEGDAVARGERIGYIAFGSRTELTLPAGSEILVRVGESVRGGETVVAKVAPAARRET